MRSGQGRQTESIEIKHPFFSWNAIPVNEDEISHCFSPSLGDFTPKAGASKEDMTAFIQGYDAFE